MKSNEPPNIKDKKDSRQERRLSRPKERQLPAESPFHAFLYEAGGNKKIRPASRKAWNIRWHLTGMLNWWNRMPVVTLWSKLSYKIGFKPAFTSSSVFLSPVKPILFMRESFDFFIQPIRRWIDENLYERFIVGLDAWVWWWCRHSPFINAGIVNHQPMDKE